MKKGRLGDVLFGALVVWSVICMAAIGYLRFGSRTAGAQPAPQPFATRVPDWKRFASRGFVFGPSSARTTLVVFSDFQCPFCRRFSAVVDSIRALHPEVKIVERHFPITALHPEAFDAAMAAECARDAGHYDSMRHMLFRDQILVEQEHWAAIAADAGIRDTNSLANCVVAQQHASAVRADINDGKAVGVSGTPSFLVNDSLYSGAVSYADLDRRLTERR